MAQSFDPFRDLDRWLEAGRIPAAMGMPMDLYRSGDQFVAQIDLPGVDPSSIDIDIEDRTLTVRAERRASSERQEGTWLVRERTSGAFARQLSLGPGVASDKVKAEYEDGVLTLHIPVAEEAKPRKISVEHSGKQAAITGEVVSDEAAGQSGQQQS